MEELEEVLSVFGDNLTIEQIELIIKKDSRLKSLLDSILDDMYVKTKKSIKLYSKSDITYNFLVVCASLNGILESNESQYEIDKYTTSLKEYLKMIEKLPMLSWEKQRQLFIEYRNTNDLSIRDKIFESNIRIPLDVVMHKYSTNLDMFLDLVQVGNIALMRAIDLFDVDRGFKFTTYAYKSIGNFVNKYYADNKGAVRVPTNTANVIYRIKMDYGTRELPTIPILAKKYNLGEDVISCAIDALRSIDSLDRSVYDGSDNEVTLGSMLEDLNACVEDDAIDNVTSRDVENYFLKHLSERELFIIKMHYGFIDGEPHTFTEIAKVLGITKQRVDQIEKKAMSKLRTKKFISLLE